jgi:hypothetical protein
MMISIVKVSLIVNIIVLTVVCFGIISGAKWISYGYGSDQPSLRILLSVYLAILISSIILLLRPSSHFIFALLCLQVIYKLLSPLVVGVYSNPVVLSNICVALLHVVSMCILYKSIYGVG